MNGLGRIALLTLLTIAAPAAAQDASSVSLPARGILDLDEGTIEFWICFGFDPQEAHEGWRSRGAVFWFRLGDRAFPKDGLSVSIGTRPMRRRPQQRDAAMVTVARFGLSLDGHEFPHPTFTPFPADLERGQWHHLAITWSHRRSQGFVDGQAFDPFIYRESFARLLTAAAQLGIGNAPDARYGLQQASLAIDDLRISSIARPVEAMGYARGELEPDAHTLLLICFEHDDKTITPTYSAVQPLSAAPMPAHWRLIPGRFGRALALSPTAFNDTDDPATRSTAP